MLKKSLIIAAAVIGTVALLLGITAIIAPRIACSYLNENGPELIGRKIYVEDISANPFTGKVTIDSLVVLEADGTQPFVRVGHLETNLAIWHLMVGVADLETLQIERLFLNVEQRDTRFNFSDILEHLGGTEQPQETSSRPVEVATTKEEAENAKESTEESGSESINLPVIIRNIAIQDSRVQYKDLLVHSHIDIDPLNLHIPGIDLRDLHTLVGIDLGFVNGGTLHTEVEYNDRSARYTVNLSLQDFALESILPYLQQHLRANDLEGTLDAQMQISGSLRHVLDFRVNGQGRVRDFELEDHKGDDALTCDSLLFGINEVNLIKNRIGLSRLEIHQPSITITYEKDHKDNLTSMIVDEMPTETASPSAGTAMTHEIASNNAPGETPPSSTSAAEEPLHLTIDQFIIQEGRLRYRDNATAVKPFKYEVSRICLNAPQFTLEGTNHLKGKAVLGKDGSITLEYHGKLEDQSTMSVNVNVKDVRLKDFSPYTLQMFGNEITGGTFSAQLGMKTVRNKLDGHLHLLADQPKVGKKQRKLNPEYNIPFRTGIYVLTDKNGRCEFDLPLAGNIDAPEFSYKRIIFSTLGKLIVKVCTMGIGSNRTEAEQDSLMTHYTDFDLNDINLDEFGNDSIGQILMQEEF